MPKGFSGELEEVWKFKEPSGIKNWQTSYWPENNPCPYKIFDEYREVLGTRAYGCQTRQIYLSPLPAPESKDALRITEGSWNDVEPAPQQLKEPAIDEGVSVLIEAAKYGYEYHANTQFPEMSFEDNCKNNFLQKLQHTAALSNSDLKYENERLYLRIDDLERAAMYQVPVQEVERIINNIVNKNGLVIHHPEQLKQEIRNLIKST